MTINYEIIKDATLDGIADIYFHYCTAINTMIMMDENIEPVEDTEHLAYIKIDREDSFDDIKNAIKFVAQTKVKKAKLSIIVVDYSNIKDLQRLVEAINQEMDQYLGYDYSPISGYTQDYLVAVLRERS